jgi:hypothetical protein
MSVIATSTHTKSNVLKKEIWAGEGFAETVIVINDTAGTLLVGTVLGKVTATGKYKRAVQTAVDGSAVAAAIVMNEQTILGATDTKAVALTRGFAKVSKAGLVLDATYDLQAEKDVIYASLEALGIQVLDTI